MAYRRVDPESFLPPGFSAAVVQHRGIMVRSISQRLPPMHEDWAIINIHPLPEHEVLFPAVRDVVREYLVEHRRVGVRAIQRSHLGQVIVQFRSVLERDNLVLLAPSNIWMLLSPRSVTMMLGITGLFFSIMNAGLCFWGFHWIIVHQNICRLPLDRLEG
jgi:hypothetical protein